MTMNLIITPVLPSVEALPLRHITTSTSEKGKPVARAVVPMSTPSC